MGNGVENSDPDELGELVRRVRIDRLQEEGKRIGLLPSTSPDVKPSTNEKTVNSFLESLLKPKD